MIRPGRPFHVRLVDLFAVRNYTYLVSAALMLAGAFQLMQAPVGEEDKFRHTIFVLSILIFYEILILAAAVFVVRRLDIPEHGRLLSLIALALALDPTFFNQSLGTFYNLGNNAGLAVNVALLVLLPVKVWVLWRYSIAPFSPRLLTGYVLAGITVYLSPFMFLDVDAGLSYSQSYSILIWAPVVVALCLPRRSGALSSEQTFLARLVPIVTAILFLHLFNLGNVHLDTVSLGTFQPQNYPGPFVVAPFILVTNILQLRLKTHWEQAVNHLQWLAIMPALAVLFALGSPPAYHVSIAGIVLSPLHLTVALAMAILWQAAGLTGRKGYRWEALVLGFAGTLGPNLDGAISTMKQGDLTVPGAYVWLLLVILALRRRSLAAVLVAIEFTVWGVLRIWHGVSPAVTFQVMGWAALLLVLAWRKRWGAATSLVALLMFAHVFVLLLRSPSAWTEGYAWPLAAVIAVAAISAAEPALRIAGAAPLFLLVMRAGWPIVRKLAGILTAKAADASRSAADIPPGLVLVLLGFLTFGLALFFSLRRRSLAGWVEKGEEGEPGTGPPQAPGPVQDSDPEAYTSNN